jgi:2-phospho-L-lactate/phosphoenolpyruvate guanylyltransferase
MTRNGNICAVVPVKEIAQAKQRLASVLSPAARRALVRAMLEDVLSALSVTRGLAGILVVTADRTAAVIAHRFGAEISAEGARHSHTAAIGAAAALLASRSLGMLALPGDVPLVKPSDINRLIAARGNDPSFTIVPARDERGSNAVLCSPADAVALRFGENSFFPHLEAAKMRGIEPRVVHLPRIELDIDNPADVAEFCSRSSRCCSREVLDQLEFEMPHSRAQIRRRSA